MRKWRERPQNWSARISSVESPEIGSEALAFTVLLTIAAEEVDVVGELLVSSKRAALT